jgi:hypothetical protein
LSVRRFFCDDTACPRRTFVEQPMDLTRRHARRTCALGRMLTAVAIALGGRAGARLADALGMNTGRDSLLRQRAAHRSGRRHRRADLPHHSGPVEGTVNKIKMIKRQMHGRANLDLLRIRVLHAA